MRALCINPGMHNKNIGFLLKCKKIDFCFINNVKDIYNLDLTSFDAVISPCLPVDVSKFPNTKFIFGPQFSVFPDNRLDIIKGPKTSFNLLSEWVINFWKSFPICDNLKLVSLPFGVDTEKFIYTKSMRERTKVLVYFKHRNPSDLRLIEKFLQDKNVEFNVFSYNSRYNEDDYLNYLQNSKFGIWIGGHESQGFALQEALSCDVPLLVWSVKSMNQEYGSNYSDIPATTTSYWDKKCGEVFYNINDLESSYNKFIDCLETYKPREFILENLSIDSCETRFMEYINNM
jgi:hypothetical protein